MENGKYRKIIFAQPHLPMELCLDVPRKKYTKTGKKAMYMPTIGGTLPKIAYAIPGVKNIRLTSRHIAFFRSMKKTFQRRRKRKRRAVKQFYLVSYGRAKILFLLTVIVLRDKRTVAFGLTVISTIRS